MTFNDHNNDNTDNTNNNDNDNNYSFTTLLTNLFIYYITARGGPDLYSKFVV